MHVQRDIADFSFIDRIAAHFLDNCLSLQGDLIFLPVKQSDFTGEGIGNIHICLHPLNGKSDMIRQRQQYVFINLMKSGLRKLQNSACDLNEDWIDLLYDFHGIPMIICFREPIQLHARTQGDGIPVFLSEADPLPQEYHGYTGCILYQYTVVV